MPMDRLGRHLPALRTCQSRGQPNAPGPAAHPDVPGPRAQARATSGQTMALLPGRPACGALVPPTGKEPPRHDQDAAAPESGLSDAGDVLRVRPAPDGV